MAVHAFTSFNFSYLNRAKALSRTLASQHPDWVLWAVVTDRKPDGFDFDIAGSGYDRVIYADDLLGLEAERWLFGHDVVEACTAIKGHALRHILADPTAEKVFYFDPDIAVFNSLSPVVDLLDDHAIVLTPHQIAPDDASAKAAIMDNEISSLVHGVFNLGFIAVRNDPEGGRFAQWWSNRLHDWCQDRKDLGIFVDQKWCDLVPCFFESVKILRDPGYNVASWNLSQRRLRFDADGTMLVNEVPLRFFHFTKLGPIGDVMTQRYAADNIEVYELWRWYRNFVLDETDPAIPERWWYYATFDNGVEIPKSARQLYRAREDLRKAFEQPRHVANGFFGWLEANDHV